MNLRLTKMMLFLLQVQLCLLLPICTTAFAPTASNDVGLSSSTTSRYKYSSGILYGSVSADQEEEEWERMFQELQSCQGRWQDSSSNPAALSDWYKTQQRCLQFDMLASSRAERLRELGLLSSSSTTSSAEEEEWETMMTALQEFQQEHGHCSVPKIYDPNQPLANWVQQQHRSYRLDMMSSARIEQFKEMGFIVDLQQRRIEIKDVLENKWEEKFQELRLFQQKHGHCNVPKQYNPRLAEWVQYQRKWKALQHWEDRIDRLKQIGFRWEQNALN